MTNESAYESLDEELSALPVHDVAPGRAERTRARCLAAFAAPADGGRQLHERVAVARAGWVALMEPLAAIALGAIYLAAAVQASMALMGG
jgi:hypothetical protein